MNKLAMYLFWIWAIVQLVLLSAISLLFEGPGTTGFPYLAVAAGAVCGNAVAAAFGTVFNVPHKRRVAAITITLSLSSVAFAIYALRTGAPPPTAFIVMLSVASQWLIALVPLVWMKSRGWQLGPSHLGADSPPEFQFQVKHILIWTTAVALLAIGRPLLDYVANAATGEIHAILLFFAIFLVGQALMAGPLLWAVLARSGRRMWFWAAVFALCAVGYLEYYCVSGTEIADSLANPTTLVLAMTMTFVITLVWPSISMRLIGQSLHVGSATSDEDASSL